MCIIINVNKCNYIAYQTKQTFYITVVMCRLDLFPRRFLPNLFLKQTESVKKTLPRLTETIFSLLLKSDLRIGVKNVPLIG